jgi:hypothetical protein
LRSFLVNSVWFFCAFSSLSICDLEVTDALLNLFKKASVTSGSTCS